MSLERKESPTCLGFPVAFSLFSVSSYNPPLPGLLFSLIKSLKTAADTQEGYSSLVGTHRIDTPPLCSQGFYFLHPAQETV